MIKNVLCYKMVSYVVLSPVVLQLSCGTGELRLHYKETDVTCFYSALRVERLKSDLYFCCFCRAKLCLH